MNIPSIFRDSQALTAREIEVPFADFSTGMNPGASCAPGIGIATDNPDLQEQLPNWTLDDQFEDVRVPQVSQVLGGLGVTTDTDWPSSGGIEGNGSAHAEFIILATNADNLDGAPQNLPPVVQGTANLFTLEAGWVAG